jgi:diamine N-acetyltransferase
MISIREATFRDIPAMREVAISSYSDTFSPDNSKENMERYLKEFYSIAALEREFHEPATCIYLAWEEDQLVGFARLRECDEVKNLLGDNTVELHRIYVLTSTQGKSVGKYLMEASIAYAQQRKY